MNKETKYVKNEETQNNWYHIDASDAVVGRLASRIALILQGKNKPQYTPNVDNGDFVVITNAEKIKFTGKKVTDKHYNLYSGGIGGLTQPTVAQVLASHPERVIEHAVKKMLPKTILGKDMFKKLKVYSGESHPHAAQTPETIKV